MTESPEAAGVEDTETVGVDDTETAGVDDTGTGSTGDPVIDEALARLDALDHRPVHEHPAEFEAVHRVLRDTLSGQRNP